MAGSERRRSLRRAAIRGRGAERLDGHADHAFVGAAEKRERSGAQVERVVEVAAVGDGDDNAATEISGPLLRSEDAAPWAAGRAADAQARA